MILYWNNRDRVHALYTFTSSFQADQRQSHFLYREREPRTRHSDTDSRWGGIVEEVPERRNTVKVNEWAGDTFTAAVKMHNILSYNGPADPYAPSILWSRIHLPSTPFLFDIGNLPSCIIYNWIDGAKRIN